MSAGSDNFDVLIVGGGLVGMSLACALRGQALRVGLIEARPWRAPEVAVSAAATTAQRVPDFDARTVALSQGSQRIFAAMGLWEAIAAGGVMPIHRIHVSDRGHAGITRLDSAQQGVEALGYVVENRVLGAALGEALPKAMCRVLGDNSQAGSNITLICPAQVDALVFEPDHVEVRYRQDKTHHTLRTRLLVAADGGDSTVRHLIGTGVRERPYGQTAIIANVITERAHEQVAYERFTDTGPLALLPTCGPPGAEGRTSALVWTVRDAQSEEVMALDDASFLARLQARFGPRLGNFEQVSRRHAYPLSLLRAHEPREPRLVFIGNAAHTLHPVAGQGFNLGLRDVAALAEVLVDAVAQGRDPGGLSAVQAYLRWRRRDQWQVSTFTDLLVRTFSTRFLPLALARNLGLVALDLLPPAKRLLGRHAMGRIGPLPRLARGLPL